MKMRLKGAMMGALLAPQAGPGIGKTLAYLVPAILSRHRVLISTGTKQLQDQIYYKDLPALREALETDPRMAEAIPSTKGAL